MSEISLLAEAPVSLDECVILTMSDDSRYLTVRATNERVCKAYNFDAAGSGWRSKVSFFAKDGEDGFWCVYDDRKVTDTLD